MDKKLPSQQEKSPTKQPASVPSKRLKFETNSSIINFIASRHRPDKTELNRMNRKRVIQMLDIFNSKYDCKKCRKKLRYKADHIIHSKLKHITSTSNLTNRQIICPECKLHFKTYYSLTSHLMIVHLNERPYGCKICHKKFHAFALLRRHCQKKHLNSESTPSALLSPVSLNSTSSSTHSSETTDNKFNNLYDLIDYDNSNIISNEASSSTSCDSTVSSFSSASLSLSSSSSSSSSSTSSLSSTYLPLSINNPLSVNSETNMKYFNYIKTVSNSNKNTNKMDLEPILQYLNEERQLEKELINEKLNFLIPSFTICTKLTMNKCNLCLQNFTSNSEYLIHVWKKHLNFKNSNNTGFSSHCWACPTTCNSADRISFKTDILLVQHIQNHLNEEPGFRCTVCNSGFNSLQSIKSHYLTYHVYKQHQEANVEFKYNCASCDQVFPSYEHIFKHFETSHRCDSTNVTYPKLKCIQCQLEFPNKMVFNFHLNQHKYIDSINQSNNIKNSNNNKQYSIDALVNSNNRAKKTKLEDIASKISIKQQQTNTAFQIFQNALSSLINMSKATTTDNPEFGQQTNGIFGTNFSQLASTYSKLLNETKKTQDTTGMLSHSLLGQSSSLKLGSSSAFGIPKIINTDNASIIKNFMSTNSATQSSLPKTTNPLFNSLQQQFYFNNFSSLHNNPTAFDFGFKPFMTNNTLPSSPNTSNTLNNMNQKLSVQTAVPSSSTFSSPSFSSLLTSSPSPSSTAKSAFNRQFSQSEINQQLLLSDYKCEFCGYNYKNLADLVEHRALHISPNHKRPLRCHLCSIKFAKTEQLMKHMIVHKANTTDSICKLCYATFGRKQDLDRHMIFHSK